MTEEKKKVVKKVVKKKVEEAPPPEEIQQALEEVEVKQEEVIPDVPSEPESEPEYPDEEEINKFELLHEFEKKTEDYLNNFDDLVENRARCRSMYLKLLNPLRESIVALLLRYIQNDLPRDDYLYQHIKCCDETPEPLNREDFEAHYKEVHKQANKGIELLEEPIIKDYHRAVKMYLARGVVSNVELMFKLRRLLRKTNTVLLEQ
ncbi:conserved hypothetical protein [Culex quinquefasciatus]|uniref:Uncharacterized protein n=1 Tax=Culex quinquefasciatus TaxID=7176 RepID=B0WUN6_CULQU|nr:uncharacterized protein LOC6043438 [Culex quinquefasciatus]XP_039429550.1 uncharacterized protein LOC120412968 [Culex pipiens pallens]EDS35021.1 conserved hypothetical protein [Culex quinquefasciatus]EDS35022.1 conserved hypothetical protein [Culex quinquefasciatus]|eukprot:XP_001859073.1 conserved hypothetical protein [Culex quinquefasciatus]